MNLEVSDGRDRVAASTVIHLGGSGGGGYLNRKAHHPLQVCLHVQDPPQLGHLHHI